MLMDFKNVSLGYDGNIVVSGLNFSVQEGDFLCITGENGSGKSTLIKGILRLLNPIQGCINFDPLLKKTGIGYVSQESINKKDFPAGVYEIVLSGNLGKMGLRPFYTQAEKIRTDEKLRQLDIENLKKKCFRELSGGQQRRVLLARSLCAADSLLVLDEPFAELDPIISSELGEILKTMNYQFGITIIMATHDKRTINLASHILHLKKKQIFYGRINEYINSQTGKFFFEKKGGG